MEKTRSVYVSERRAFTLIEVLVSLSIIGLLVALLIPAVQSSREGARNARCLNNLRQIGLSLANYNTLMSSYPSASNGRHGFSVHSMILPQLEQVSIYNSINFDVYWFERSNFTARYTNIASFVCPSSSKPGSLGSTSYACNGGYGLESQGAFVSEGEGSALTASIIDGLSATVALTEWNFVVPGERQIHRVSGNFSFDKDLEKFLDKCRTSFSSPTTLNIGSNWLDGSYGETIYNHDLIINQNYCINNDDVPSGAWTAGSNHPYSANSVFLDGHARKIRQSISLPVWRALATRSGGEIVDPIDF